MADDLAPPLARLLAVATRLNTLDPRAPHAVDTVVRLVEEGVGQAVPGATGAVYTAERAGESAATALTLPLSAGGVPLGVLYVYAAPDAMLTAADELLLRNLAQLAARTLAHASEASDTQRTVARKEDELALLRRAGLLISSRTQLDDTLEAILQMALEVTGARYGIFRLVDRAGENLVMRAIAGDRLGQPAVETLPINATSVMGLVAKTRQTVNITDVHASPWSRIYYPLDHALEMRAELAVPLIGAGGRLEGVLNLESPQAGAFSEADSHLLQGLATQAVIAIQEVRLLDALRDMAARVLSQDVAQVHAHLDALAAELVSGDTEWDRKIAAILAQYAALAEENAARQAELRAAQEARGVAETFAAMGDVAANLLHHLNNKVGTIPVRVEGIQDKCGDALRANPYLAANLGEIERAALDAMQTVRERLALLRPIEIAPVAVGECVEDALKTARLPHGMRVSVERLDALPLVQAGREGLALAFINLLENAAEAMGGVGDVRIAGEARGNRVELSVTDTGPGISPEQQSRIFEFDYSARRRSARGRLGFGLWWVKSLMTRLGGSITVESDGKQGTTFRMRLLCAP